MTTVFTGRRRPHEVMIIVWSAAAGILHFAADPPPNSIDLLYPAWMSATWYVLIGLGGLVGLAGLAVRGVLPALSLERASMCAIGAGAGIYALAVLYVGGWRALVAGGLIACWSAACAWRAVQITVDLRRVTRDAP